jgi:hypothetical protein
MCDVSRDSALPLGTELTSYDRTDAHVTIMAIMIAVAQTMMQQNVTTVGQPSTLTIV